MSGWTPMRGVAMVNMEAPAAMPMPTASVPYTLRMCSTTPKPSASH